MFIDEKTQNKIHADLNASVSHGTMRPCDLIPAFTEVIRDTPEYIQLMCVVPCYAAEDKNADWWDSEEAVIHLENLTDCLDNYAPEGYYFGAHPGDGSDYGYWEIEDDQNNTETKSVWLRLGVTLNGSKKDIEKVLSKDTEIYRKLLDARQFEIEGETYIPASVVEEYNAKNQTNFAEKDIDL